MSRLKLINKHAPGPWTYCGQDRGDPLTAALDPILGGGKRTREDYLCECGFIWSRPADAPIATVTLGVWGDTYPAIRIKEPGSIGAVAEPYTERIDYGEIPYECALANARLIAVAPDLLACCVEFVRNVKSVEMQSVRSYDQMKQVIMKAWAITDEEFEALDWTTITTEDEKQTDIEDLVPQN